MNRSQNNNVVSRCFTFDRGVPSYYDHHRKSRNGSMTNPAISKTEVSTISLPTKEDMKSVLLFMDGYDGKISLTELEVAVMLLYPQFQNEPALAAACKSFHILGNGFLEQNEFSFFLCYLVYYNNLSLLFQNFGKDNDSIVISRQELLQAADHIADLRENPGDIFDSIDLNCEGTILLEDLCNYLAFRQLDLGVEDMANIKQNRNNSMSDDFPTPRMKNGISTLASPHQSELVILCKHFQDVRTDLKRNTNEMKAELKENHTRLSIVEDKLIAEAENRRKFVFYLIFTSMQLMVS